MNERLMFLRKKAGELPPTPGVYLMRDKNGVILYVGKSKKLQNRVMSYFVGEKRNYKTARMVERVYDFDTVLCDTEIEALALENTLIKKHTPKYNIKLKDAKSYPYIKITADAYPALIVTRDRHADGGKYFGPYSGMSVAYDVADTVRRIFALPTCKRRFPRDIGKERPCLYRDMGRCTAPCAGDITKEAYRARMAQVADVLSGNMKSAVEAVEADMRRAAEEERFEEAARYRDSITALKNLREKQKVLGDETAEQDAVAFYSDDVCGVLSVLNIRGGKLNNKNDFLFSGNEILEDEDCVSFLCRYYGDAVDIPREILLSFDPGEEECLWLSDRLTEIKGRRVAVRSPKRGDNRKICDMAYHNAEEKAAVYRREREKEDKNLILLSSMLGLEVIPDRIEAYDISNIGDEAITASMVVYENGGMKKSDYRTFRVRVGETRDDFASMKEALSRRLAHIGKEEGSLGTRPDLILLDGGKGQVSAVREAMAECGADIPLFGMVKDDFHKTRALTDGENEIGIAKEPGVYALIYRIQEEAHRVAYTHSQNRKRRTLTHSELEKIPGIGEKKARLLLTAFAGIQRLKNADFEEIRAVRGIRDAEARAVYNHFHNEGKEE